jgi:hypothetical protein
MNLVLLALLPEFRFETKEIETGLKVGYAIRVADVNNDRKPDLIVLDSQRVLWYENPTWQRHVVLDGQTPPDNVAVAAHDVNGDGKLDLAVGADWQFGPTNVGHLFWLEQRGLGEPWKLHRLGEAPFVHRMQWVDVTGDGKPELVVVPLLGVGKNQAERQANPVSITYYSIPANPQTDRWTPVELDRSLHVCHNFLFADFDRRGENDLVVASFEGLTQFRRTGVDWKPTRIVDGDQHSKPNRGCSEVAYVKGKTLEAFATIEPWHGHQVVVYTRTGPPEKPWRRTVLDGDLQWGHAVSWADLDGDGDAELVAGVRDDKPNGGRRGVRIYRRRDERWERQLLDAGGVAVEDLATGDFDGDGRIDIAVSGRQTHNVRIYWNKGTP